MSVELVQNTPLVEEKTRCGSAQSPGNVENDLSQVQKGMNSRRKKNKQTKKAQILERDKLVRGVVKETLKKKSSSKAVIKNVPASVSISEGKGEDNGKLVEFAGSQNNILNSEGVLHENLTNFSGKENGIPKILPSEVVASGSRDPPDVNKRFSFPVSRETKVDYLKIVPGFEKPSQSQCHNE